MTYEVSIETDFERTPFRDAWGSHSIRFLLGYDTAADVMAYMVAMFVFKEEGIYDLRFGIDERLISSPEQYFGIDYSIEYSKTYVPDEYRPLVLGCLIEALGCIVDTCTPKKVTMMSFYKSLPDKALVKYQRICQMMGERGYVIVPFTYGNPPRRYWSFERAR
jgi:hypothetical protein